MKKLGAIFGCLLLVIMMAGCGKNGGEDISIPDNSSSVSTEIDVETETNDNKIAVVYFSGTGNTKAVAEMIAEETGADLFEIVPKQEYTDEDLNYNNNDCRANKEQNDEYARPEISNDLSATTKYDIIYLGHPIWWGTVPRIIQTYLEQYDISGAAIYSFCTSGGSGIEKSISDLREWYPSLNIVDGKRLNDATPNDIKEFCTR